ncbi:MAG: RNA polymerase sigma factor, partial [Calditrichaeota bacterium]
TMAKENLENLSDEALMALYQQGEMQAFEFLYTRYEKKIYNFLLRRIGDVESAQELFQNVFLTLHRNRHQFDTKLNFSTWFFTMANNLLKNEFKRLYRMRKNLEHVLINFTAIDSNNGHAELEELIIKQENTQLIKKALSALPESQREILLLSKFEGFTYPEIAEIMGCSVASVKQKAYRAYLTLREKLEKHLGVI